MSRSSSCIAAAAVVAAMAAPAASSAATISVGTVDDVVAADGRCSLREAVQAANVDAASGGCAAGAGADVVELPAGTFTLSAASGALGVLADVTLRGAGTATVIQAQGTRILTIANLTPPSVTVEGITFRDGHAPDGTSAPAVNGTNGGAGQNGGNAVAQAGTAAGDGGAIVNATSGTLTVLRCVFESNTAGDGGAGGQAQGGNGGPGTTAGGLGTGGAGGAGGKGGAISTLGPLVVRDSTFSGNAAGDGGAGGAAFGGTGGNASSVNANGGGGGLAVGGVGGAGGAGGAIHSASTVTIERSTFLSNGSGTGGAGGAATAGAGGVAGSSSGTGGFGGTGIGGDGGFGADGGAVNAGGGDVVIKSSTLRLNFVGAAGAGGTGTGGAGGDSPAPGATGGSGGQALGGNGDIAGNGGAVRTAGRLTVEASLIAGTSGGLGGRGGDAVGGRGGNATNTSAEAQGGAGGAATGGIGHSGGIGALNMGSLNVLNSTIDGSTFGGGGRGGNATGGAGGTGEPVNNVGRGGSATGGRGGAAGVAGMAAGGSITARSVTASGLATPGPAAGGTATSGGLGGAASPGSAGAPGVGAFQALNNGSLTATLIVASGPKACDGPLANGGFSLEFPRPGESASCPATLVGDPLLVALGDFGGPTWTRPLGNAIGVDAVPAGAACPATDQRGVSRPRGSACDVGAYERAAPEATTGAVDAIGGTAATLHATVNPNGPAATVRFEYGTTTAYGAVTPGASVPVGLAGSPVAATAANLQPGTTYHYRVVAATSDGTTAGADATFTTTAGASSSDKVAPVFRSASLQPATFRVRKKGTRTGGSRLSWRLSERARIVVTVARATAGRRAGARCVAPTRRNRSARRCTRYVVVGRIAIGAVTQTGSRTFTGRLGRRSLRPGRHRATLVATDAAGNASAPKRLAFRIKR